MSLSAKEIRAQFISFFSEKEHKIVSSAPVVVKDDPTLMFTNAGMNQFKDYFLGNKTAVSKRVADTQKCLRVSGKHNDLEEVGVDTYHHTLFEMLGNWSFGDYFKEEAIAWAWELLTEVYKIDKSRMYATIFEGDETDGLELDEEAKKYWLKYMPENRILPFDKKDNFWEMGETGPCGPCSEIHVDLRSDEERAKLDGRELVNADHPEVIEIWNLVFIQFNRKKDGSLVELPNKHIDTGMGFERLAMVLQGKSSSYDSDVFQPLIRFIEKGSGFNYGKNKETDIAIRVMADHVRAVAFAIADGQLPSNNGAGYVIRRILRRAVRYGYSFLNLKEPFLNQMVAVLADQFEGVFPEIISQRQLIEKVIQEEEAGFLKTLDSGLGRLANLESQLKSEKKNTIPGTEAFELYDTFGFPFDLTKLIASEKGLEVDEDGFNKAMQQQKDRSRNAAAADTGEWVRLSEGEENFIGYDNLEADIKITKYRKVVTGKKVNFQLVFNTTPFYPEGGGQVGDTGTISNANESIKIVDTVKENQLILHIAPKLPKDPQAVFQAMVDGKKRIDTMRNHTATHLLHQALREVLGTHVEQKGSLVNSKYLRFDFSHFQKIEKTELDKIQSIINERIRMNIPLEEMRSIELAKAKEMGAMALFGEKYGDSVRVIKFGESIELCGGTHVPATGSIGTFKLAVETSVAAGIRRVEAYTGEEAENLLQVQSDTLQKIKDLLKASGDIFKGVENLVQENSRLNKELQHLSSLQVNILKDDLLKTVENHGGINLISAKVDLDGDAMKQLAYDLKRETENMFLVLGSQANGKALLTIMIAENLVKDKGLNAGTMIREIAREIKGGGGGQPFYATAGGKDPNGIDAALDLARKQIMSL